MESLRAVGGGGLHALHAILLSFPIAFFAGGVTSDIAYLVRRRVLLRTDVEPGSWYPFQARHPQASRNGRVFRRAIARTTTLVCSNYPAPMAVKMLLKPLALPPVLNRVSHRTVLMAQRLILH